MDLLSTNEVQSIASLLGVDDSKRSKAKGLSPSMLGGYQKSKKCLAARAAKKRAKQSKRVNRILK